MPISVNLVSLYLFSITLLPTNASCLEVSKVHMWSTFNISWVMLYYLFSLCIETAHCESGH